MVNATPRPVIWRGAVTVDNTLSTPVIGVGCFAWPSKSSLPLPASSLMVTDRFPAAKIASPLLSTSKCPISSGLYGFPGSDGSAPKRTAELCFNVTLSISFKKSCMLAVGGFEPVTRTVDVLSTFVPTSGPQTVVLPTLIRSKLSITKFASSTVLVLLDPDSPLPVA